MASEGVDADGLFLTRTEKEVLLYNNTALGGKEENADGTAGSCVEVIILENYVRSANWSPSEPKEVRIRFLKRQLGTL